ncbi:MAG TPA: DUF4190 domain-containing protein [Candidatus Angelobacter sp.]|nr:DUF4190 domain-containing protein [Candidatus Angelobacter sp.]
MFCQQCGMDVPENSHFCLQCGAAIAANARGATLTARNSAQETVSTAATTTVEPSLSQKTDPTAIWSLALGILSLICLVFTGIPAIILGHTARTNIRRHPGRVKGGGMALAGLTLGYLGATALPLVIAVAVLLPSFSRMRISANEEKAATEMRTLSIAIETYKTQYNGYPPSLQALGPAAGSPSADAASLINSKLSAGTSGVYRYTYQRIDGQPMNGIGGFTLRGDPTSDDGGVKHYFTDQTGLIRYQNNKAAGPRGPLVNS